MAARDTWDGLAVHRHGVGPGVLWLHGYTMSSRVWRPLWERLPGWRHIGLDLPGHGASRDLSPTEDLASLADTVVAAARDEKVQHVVGLSFGTVLAAETAIRHPDAFASWVLAAPALARMPHGPAVAQRYRDLLTHYAEHGAGPHLTELWLSSPPAIFAGAAARPEVMRGLRAVVDEHRWSELATGGMAPLVSRTQAPRELGGVAGRLTVIIGERDLLEHRACARSLSQQVAGVTVHVLPGCGHLPLLEEPALVAPLLESAWRQPVSR